MRAITGAAAALLVASLAAAAPAGAREQSTKCFPKRGSETLAASTRVRVLQTHDPADGADLYYACDLLTGRRTEIAAIPFDEGYSIGKIRFAGRIVAFTQTACSGRTPLIDPDPCDESVRSIDVKTRRQRGSLVAGSLGDLVVSPNGSLAWIETASSGPASRSVHRVAGDGPAETLDSGPSVEIGSLALARDGRLYWRSGNVTRSALLDPAPPTPSRSADPEPRGRRACFPAGSTAVAASTRVRVYELDDEGAGRSAYVACDLRSGRRTELESFDLEGQSHSVDEVRLAGSWVAIAIHDCLKGGCDTSLITADVTRAGPNGVVRSFGGEAEVRDLALEADGSVAWTTAPAPSVYFNGGTIQVGRCDGSGCASLDSGDGIEPESLGLSAQSDLYWTHGSPRSAVLQ